MKSGKTEITAPAGSFSAAIYALSKGADAVYAGLSAFSARRHARNLDLDQLCRLRQYAAEHGKKVYIALNTVIREQELPEICGLLVDLAFLKIDGVIIQDAGLLFLLKKYFPGLPVHASTQMAVYNTEGVKYLQQCGVRRVILSRELSFNQIKQIREAVSDVELEVFVHGALCYGFSGLCLTSGLLLGRSGNRGDCAQVCRSWFTHDNHKGYFFSCNDLALKENVRSLQEAGIDALKIEGRMKSPEYAGLTAAYYRSILADGEAGKQAACLEQIQLCFSRNQTPGFFTGAACAELVNPAYPSHTGLYAGKVVSVQQHRLCLCLERDVAVHEGLLFFTGKNPAQPVQFGIKTITIQKKHAFTAQAGAQIWVESSKPLPVLPQPGDPVYKISSQELQWPEFKPAAFPAWKKKIRGKVVLTGTALTFTAEPDDGAVQTGFPAFACTCSMELTPLPAEGSRNFRKILSALLMKSGNSPFEIADVIFFNESELPDTGIFIQPSVLKQFKNRVYTQLGLGYTKLKKEVIRQITGNLPGSLETGRSDLLPVQKKTTGPFPRSLIWYSGLELPFMLNPGTAMLQALPLYRDKRVIALPPVIANPGHYLSDLAGFLNQYKDTTFLIGLNNVSHFAWLDVLYRLPGVSFFIDYCLYCANSSAFRYFSEHVQRLEFILYWIEGKETDFFDLEQVVKGEPVPLLRADNAFKPHLFLSKVCFRQQSLHQKCRECPKQAIYRIEQNGKPYRVVVKDCLTYVFRE